MPEADNGIQEPTISDTYDVSKVLVRAHGPYADALEALINNAGPSPKVNLTGLFRAVSKSALADRNDEFSPPLNHSLSTLLQRADAAIDGPDTSAGEWLLPGQCDVCRHLLSLVVSNGLPRS